MASSTVVKEAEKRDKAKAQVEANAQSEVTEGEFAGRNVKEVVLFPIDSYSTKFMSPKDQVTLAVDKIDTPEIRLTLSPVPTHPRYYADPQVKFYDYESRLSLNDGDPDAFEILSDAFFDGVMWKFKMDGEQSFMIAYGKDVVDGTLFVFDLYIEPDSPYPDITATFAMTESERSIDYTNEMVWEYLVTMHGPENRKPKDAEIKTAYGELKEYMRSAIAALGVFPSKL